MVKTKVQSITFIFQFSLEKYLKMYQRQEKVLEVEKLPEKDQVALARASKLRVFKK